jgi:diaminopimelate decarboxylase
MAVHLSPEQLKAIAQEFGTPVYVYHAEKITANTINLQRLLNLPKPRSFMPVKRSPI